MNRKKLREKIAECKIRKAEKAIKKWREDKNKKPFSPFTIWEYRREYSIK